VCYATTEAGLELPVVDITHPAFASTVAGAEQQTIAEPRWISGLP
jgi:hypothetical protein